jgi:hypothetical protein
MIQKHATKLLFFSALTIVLLLSTMPLGAAQSTTPTTPTSNIQTPSYCTSITSNSLISSTTNNTAFSNILLVSLIIMMMMIAVVGILYALGYAFRYEKLLRFSKAEIGEVFITILIVLIFLGTITGVNSLTGASKVFALSNGTFNSNMFTTDCSYLGQTTVVLWGNLFTLFADQVALSIFSNLQITINPIELGVSGILSGSIGVAFRPFEGLSLIGGNVSLLSGFWSGFALLITLALFLSTTIFTLIGMMFFLGFVFSFFPIFLYLGILLRTLPWTRPAGGAFLGVFIGFYIFFPTMLYLLLSLNPISSTAGLVPICSAASGSTCSLSSSLQGITTSIFTNLLTTAANPVGALSTSNFMKIFACGIAQIVPVVGQTTIGGTCLFTNLVQGTVAPAVYTIFALLISLLLAFDFASAVAKLLGAPSLQAKHVLRNIL